MSVSEWMRNPTKSELLSGNLTIFNINFGKLQCSTGGVIQNEFIYKWFIVYVESPESKSTSLRTQPSQLPRHMMWATSSHRYKQIGSLEITVYYYSIHCIQNYGGKHQRTSIPETRSYLLVTPCVFYFPNNPSREYKHPLNGPKYNCKSPTNPWFLGSVQYWEGDYKTTNRPNKPSNFWFAQQTIDISK